VKSLLPHNVIQRRVDTTARPVVGHMLIGAGGGLTLLLIAGALFLSLLAFAKASGDTSGAGGLVGFMIVPLVGLAGAPWSVLIYRLDSGNSSLFLAAFIAGPLINGALIGAARGYFAARRENRSL
jgi:hypothetical protein